MPLKKAGLIFLLILSSALQAAQPELGVNAGIAANTQTSYTFPSTIPYRQSFGKEPFLSAKLLFNLDSWQLGGLIAYTMPHISYKEEAGEEFKVLLARPLIPVALLANKKIQLGENHSFYAGIALGVGLSLSTSASIAQRQYELKNSAVMPLVGAQVGYVYYFGRVGFNAEISVMGLPEWTGETDIYGYTVYAFTLGMRFRI